jgi:hypothetical protein
LVEEAPRAWGAVDRRLAAWFVLADTGRFARQGGEAKAGAEGREERGEMSRVRIYDLGKELKPETKKSLKVARSMGIAGALNVAGPRRKPPTKKTKKGGAK